MTAAMLPVRHDMVTFDYAGESFTGEVRRVSEKPKGYLVLVQVGEGQYRSCYLEKMTNLKVQKINN